MSVVSLLLSLLIVLLICGLIFYVLRQIPMEQWMRNVAIAIVAIILVIYLLTLLPGVTLVVR